VGCASRRVAAVGCASGRVAAVGCASGRVAAVGCASGRVAAVGCASGRVAAVGCASGRVAAVGCASGRVAAESFASGHACGSHCCLAAGSGFGSDSTAVVRATRNAIAGPTVTAIGSVGVDCPSACGRDRYRGRSRAPEATEFVSAV
jgi:hypothetical protein